MTCFLPGPEGGRCWKIVDFMDYLTTYSQVEIPVSLVFASKYIRFLCYWMVSLLSFQNLVILTLNPYWKWKDSLGLDWFYLEFFTVCFWYNFSIKSTWNGPYEKHRSIQQQRVEQVRTDVWIVLRNDYWLSIEWN